MKSVMGFFIDDDNVLKILTGNTAITNKIRRTTVGNITGIRYID